MDYRLHKLDPSLLGWTAYFGINQYNRPVPELGHWIRRRIGMCYWKQWRWPCTKIRHFLALGVSLKPGDPAWSQQQKLCRTKGRPVDGISPANGTWRAPRHCSIPCPTRG
jgi:hypothetical protein